MSLIYGVIGKNGGKNVRFRSRNDLLIMKSVEFVSENTLTKDQVDHLFLELEKNISEIGFAKCNRVFLHNIEGEYGSWETDIKSILEDDHPRGADYRFNIRRFNSYCNNENQAIHLYSLSSKIDQALIKRKKDVGEFNYDGILFNIGGAAIYNLDRAEKLTLFMDKYAAYLFFDLRAWLTEKWEELRWWVRSS